MEVLFETSGLKITLDSGESEENVAALAFTGVGHKFDGIQQEEFTKTLKQSGIVQDSYCIIDKYRSWYKRTSADIVFFLEPKLRGRRVITLGNSMGGFGSIYFSGVFSNVETSISFAPQYSIDKSIVPFETRWNEYASEAEKYPLMNCFSRYNARCRKFIFCGSESKIDLQHADLIRRNSDYNTCIYAIDGCGHNVASILKEKKVLHKVIHTAMDISASFKDVGNLLLSHGVRHTPFSGLRSLDMVNTQAAVYGCNEGR